MESLLRNLRLLWRSEILLAEVHLRTLGRKTGLLAFALLVGVFALGMLNLAGYFALEPGLGRVNAALIVAGADLVIAAVALGIAQRLKPGPETAMVQEVRDMALGEIEAEFESVQKELRSLRDEIKDAKAAIVSVAKNPLEILGPNMLVPLLSTLASLLRSGKK